MPNSTCRLLSNGYKFDTRNDNELYYLPCCSFNGGNLAVLSDEQEHIKYRAKLNSIDSQTYPGCEPCNFLNNEIKRKTWRDHSFEIVPDDAELGDASYVEIQIDRTCNGGCIICGPWYSSYWVNEEKKIPIQTQTRREYVDQILSIIDIQKTRKINFLGGEPFLTTTDTEILEKIRDPSQVELQYTTNGSIFPGNDRIKRWKEFKSVMINFSIDAIGTKFEYIRYPLNWATVEENVIRLRNILPESIAKFKINHTVNIFNLYYLDEFEHWYNTVFNSNKFLNNRVIPYTFSPANGVLSPHAVPQKLYDLMAKKYSSDSRSMKVITTTRFSSVPVLNYINRLDQRRNLDWRTVFPDIKDIFD